VPESLIPAMPPDPLPDDESAPAQRRGPVVAWYWALLVVFAGTIATGLGIRALFP
jgi:hypothetical protein